MAMLFAYAVGGRRQQVLIESTTCFIVITLMCLQCTRRCFETNCVQILSRKSQLNVLYYIIGYLHYFGILLIPMINAEGFVEGSKPSSINLFNMPLGQYVCILMFLMCWWYQYRSNIMLVNFRKDYKTGKVKTEEYILPRGGLFEYVSSPHMLCEVGMYIALLGFLYRLTTWWLVILWVVSNQIYVSVSSHSWYKKTFVNYPTKRKAIFPMIL
uniref:Polyprenal reductase n=1 Tax=Stomoxys calcitrans TaxID=35570 RepID=A0A1I8PJK6_STOCA